MDRKTSQIYSAIVKYLMLMIKNIVFKCYKLLIKCKRTNVRFEENTIINTKCRFEGHNLIASGTVLRRVFLGYGSYVGNNCCIQSTKVGRYTSIGPQVRTYIGRHPVSDFVSTHPAFYAKNHPCGVGYVERQKFEEVQYACNDSGNAYAVSIGNDVWIGGGVTILDGVTIGDGAVVAANSFVNKDVAPYSIVAGTPAKEIRKRFTEEQIETLLKIKWWEKGQNWIQDNADSFEDIARFLTHMAD